MAAARTTTVLPFLILTFVITWGLQIPGVLAQRGLLCGNAEAYVPFAALGIFGPLIAATLLSWRSAGRAGVRELYAPLLRWRVHVAWYVIALFLPAALLTGGLLLLNAAGRQGPMSYFPSAGGFVFGVVISLAEEVGWRGYAVPRLRQRWGAFGASALIGVVWYAWHIPMFVGLGVPLNLLLVMLLYFIGASLYMTWLQDRAGGSLLIVVLAHLGAHLDNSHRALPGEVLPLVVHAIVYAGLGLFVMRRSLRLASWKVENARRV